MITHVRSLSSRVLSLRWFHQQAERGACRQSSTSSNDDCSQETKRVARNDEAKLISLLRTRFPNARHIDVVDISGGCGAMYTVYVETIDFKGVKKVRQHQMVNDVLLSEIKNNMHGLRIQTAVPSSFSNDTKT